MDANIQVRDIDNSALDALSELPSVLARIYAARGVRAVKDVEYALSQLHSYDKLLGIDKAQTCIADALMQQKRITIVGDFDADGATSTAVLWSALTMFGAQHVNFLVPNRFEYGYGLTPEIVDVAAETQQPDMIITVDNGISSLEGVRAAKEKGVQVVVTDHHLAADELPDADAIINPNQPGCSFPSKNLAGVGVIFYVMLAVRAELKRRDWFTQQSIDVPNMASLLDLVALGTVADVVPLDKNNRILVQQGLARIRAGYARPGILAMLKIANRDASQLVASDLGFAIGPRLNAAGRLQDMSIGIHCLLSNSQAQAEQLAIELDSLNKERRNIESDMQQQAMQVLYKLQLNEAELPVGLCLYDEKWHQGVIGILASRIKDKFHRPVIAFAKVNEQEVKGSARSITGLHIRDALDVVAKRHPEILSKFGGHAMAAGMTLRLEHLEAFKKAFDEQVRATLNEEQLQRTFVSDGELDKSDFTLPLAELLREAGPWGQAFPEPTFHGTFDILQQRVVGDKHLKLVVSLGADSVPLDAIAFNVDLNTWPNHRCPRAQLFYRLDVNRYRGRKSVQLLVESLAPAESMSEIEAESSFGS